MQGAGCWEVSVNSIRHKFKLLDTAFGAVDLNTAVTDDFLPIMLQAFSQRLASVVSR